MRMDGDANGMEKGLIVDIRMWCGAVLGGDGGWVFKRNQRGTWWGHSTVGPFQECESRVSTPNEM